MGVRIKLQSKILLMLFAIVLLTTSVIGIISFNIGNEELEDVTFRKLTAIREMKASQIESYFQIISDQVLTYSDDLMVINAALDFQRGFDEMAIQLDYSQSEQGRIDSALNSYYEYQFIDNLFYRDTTINYFSIPKNEVSLNQERWLQYTKGGSISMDSVGFIPKIDPHEFRGKIGLAGSSTVSSLANYIIESFIEEGASGEIPYNKTSTYQGIKALIEGSEVDIAGLSHELNETELRLFDEANLIPILFRIGTDALVVVVSDKNSFLTNLSIEELKMIFTEGRKWSDINPEWPEEVITKFIPANGSGSYNVFSDVILDGDKNGLLNAPNTIIIKDGEYMQQHMDTDPFSIAFFSYNYYKSDSALKILDIEDVALNNSNVRNNRYLLTRPLFLATTVSKLSSNENVAILLNYFIQSIESEVGVNLNKIDYWPQEFYQRVLQHEFVLKDNRAKVESQSSSNSIKERSYNFWHQQYHSKFKNYLERFGYYDIFIIDRSGNVIYSVKKEVDFATNLISGPHRESNLAEVFKKSINSGSSNYVGLIDFKEYLPSFNAPAAFIASPIVSGSETVGVLAFQLPVGEINEIMTNNYDWQNVGLGRTGETYIVGIDNIMRNQSRFLVEDSEKYINSLKELNFDHELISKIKTLNSTVGLQPVYTSGTEAALNGETGIKVFQDYRGVEVMSSYRPLKIEGLDWVILSEIDTSEAFEAIPLLVKSFFKWLIPLLLIILLIAVLFSRSISRPVQLLSLRATEIANGELDTPISISQRDEIGDLALNFNKMRVSLKDSLEQLTELNENLEKTVQIRTEELSDSNKNIRAILDSLLDSLIIIDENGIIQSCSQSTESMFLYSRDELIGQNIKMLMPSPHYEEHDGYLKEYKKTGVKKILGSRRDLTAKRKNGEIFPARLMVNEVITGKGKVFVGLLGDLTETKKAEAEIRRSEEFRRLILNSTAEGIYGVDLDGNCTFANPSCVKLLGYDNQGELLGKNMHNLIHHTLPNGDPYIMQNCQIYMAFQKGINVHVDDEVFWKKDGTSFPVEYWSYPLRVDQEVVGSVLTFTDITERKRLEEIMLREKNRMEEELNVANEIQMSMLPLIFPAFPQRDEIDIFADLIPAREVGGDFYDFHFVDANHFYFVVGDVSGKGVPAALMMAVTKTLLKSRANNDRSTASILTHVNNEISKDNDAYMFITVFIAILNTITGEIVYSNAGHNPPYIVTQDREIIKMDNLHGPVIGAMEDMTYTESKISVSKDDIILLYTDGITESQNTNEELYSEPRLIDLLKNGKYSDPKSLVKLIETSVIEFQGNADQYDDLTLLSIEYLVDEKGPEENNFSVSITNNLGEMPMVIDAFENFGMQNHLSFQVIQKFNVVLDELLNNIISYGFNDDLEHEIQVNVELSVKRLTITIKDDGIPFNPFRNDPPDTMLSVEERNVGGLGIHLVKNLVDEFNYMRSTNMNVITLIKHDINN